MKNHKSKIGSLLENQQPTSYKTADILFNPVIEIFTFKMD